MPDKKPDYVSARRFAVGDDDAWVNDRAARIYRMRDPVPHEFGKPSEPPKNMRRHVVVIRSSDGEHVRTPILRHWLSTVVADDDAAIAAALHEASKV